MCHALETRLSLVVDPIESQYTGMDRITHIHNRQRTSQPGGSRLDVIRMRSRIPDAEEDVNVYHSFDSNQWTLDGYRYWSTTGMSAQVCTQICTDVTRDRNFTYAGTGGDYGNECCMYSFLHPYGNRQKRSHDS